LASHSNYIKNYITNLELQDWKSLILFFYFCLFQIAIVLQLPFVQIDFAIHFYLAAIFLFVHHLILYQAKISSHVVSTVLDILIFFWLMGQHSILISFNLIIILILLFLAGLNHTKNESLVVLMLSSIMLSITNLFFIRWEGLQNLFSMVLFNFSFMSVVYISQQFKYELIDLKLAISEVSKKLRSQEEFAHVLIEKMPTGITALGAQNELLYANNNLYSTLNLSHEDLKSLNQQTENRNFSEVHFFNSNLNIKKIYEINKAQYWDEYLNSYVSLMMLKDVTDIKNLQDEIKQKEKLAAIGQLAAGIAHEIRNPLAGISGSIQLLSSETQNQDDLKLMKIIHKEIDRLNNLITEFLDYSKPEKRPDQKIDLALVVNEVVQNIKLSNQTPQNLSLILQINSGLILGFADKLKQAFLNIMMNAIQAMSTVAQPILKINLEAYEEYVQLTIEDNGCGMSLETQKRIFEPFYTTKNKGTGLGLAITHKVLDSHQVKMKIESELGQGTKFILIFNRA